VVYRSTGTDLINGFVDNNGPQADLFRYGP
jgi:hypothetical protein